jgi:hypothetical protein
VVFCRKKGKLIFPDRGVHCDSSNCPCGKGQRRELFEPSSSIDVSRPEEPVSRVSEVHEPRPWIIEECTAPGSVDNRYTPRPKAVDGGIGMSAGGDSGILDVIDHTLK